jgi:hypothetical protein
VHAIKLALPFFLCLSSHIRPGGEWKQKHADYVLKVFMSRIKKVHLLNVFRVTSRFRVFLQLVTV